MENSIFLNIINSSWRDIFLSIDKNIRENVEKKYIKLINTSINNNIFPSYNNIFNFTNYCIFDDIKVIIISQDPYHNLYYNNIDKTYYPQATGLAFSVNKECTKLPPSLINIYENLAKYNHQIFKPSHGNLEYWAYQGVLLLNTSLTVEKSKPNSHQLIWTSFVDTLIKIISSKHQGLIFVLWGAHALKKKI